MTRRVPSRRSALEERSRKGAPPVRSASNLDNCPFKRRKRHSENGAALSCDIAYAPARHTPVTSESTARRNGQKAIDKAADSFSSAVKPVMLAREDNPIDENLRRCHKHHDGAQHKQRQ